jgi:hypothetical protein
MADEPQANGPVLPPKLDLRKKGILKTPQAVMPAEPRTPTGDAPTEADVATAPVTQPTAPAAPAATASAPVSAGAPTATIRLRPKLPSGVAPAAPASAAAQVASPAGPIPLRPKQPVIPPAAPTPVSQTGASAKRETSRIPLETARAPADSNSPGGVTAPKTIRIKPVSIAGHGAIPNARPGAPATSAGAGPMDAKRQTSRISLEAALGSEDKPGEGPKTIRLKRPSDGGTVRVSRPNVVAAAGKTAEIDVPDEEDVPTTQRRTIKVKRPTQRRTVKSVSVARRPGEDGQAGVPLAAQADGSGVMTRPVDGAHWTFVTFAILSTILCLVIIYMFASQAFGPDFSLTRLSYGLREMDLPWPGKLGH